MEQNRKVFESGTRREGRWESKLAELIHIYREK
jgi:hypothetical protein